MAMSDGNNEPSSNNIELSSNNINNDTNNIESSRNNGSNNEDGVKCSCHCCHQTDALLKKIHCFYWKEKDHEKRMHFECYVRHVLQKNNFVHFNTKNLDGPYNKIVCTKKCWVKENKAVLLEILITVICYGLMTVSMVWTIQLCVQKRCLLSGF